MMKFQELQEAIDSHAFTLNITPIYASGCMPEVSFSLFMYNLMLVFICILILCYDFKFTRTYNLA